MILLDNWPTMNIEGKEMSIESADPMSTGLFEEM